MLYEQIEKCFEYVSGFRTNPIDYRAQYGVVAYQTQ